MLRLLVLLAALFLPFQAFAQDSGAQSGGSDSAPAADQSAPAASTPAAASSDAGTSGPITYGADGTSGAPYVFKDPSNPQNTIGFEVDIMEEIGKQVSRPVKFVQNNWDNLIPGLNNELYDVVIDGLEITPQHQAVVDFTVPYYVTYGQIVIRRGDKPVNDLSDMKGQTVGTLGGSQMEYVLRHAEGLIVRDYDEEIDAYTDLRNGRIDATVMDYPIAVYYAKPDRALQFVGDPVGRIEYGIAMKKGAHPELRGELNAALSKMQKDGTLRKILERWAIWTPEMAKYTGDDTPLDAQPVEYDRFVAATQPSGFLAQLERYWRFMPDLGAAAVVTMEVSICAMVIAVSLGILLALARVYGNKALNILAQTYTEIVRGTPLLIQILFIYYGLPNIGIQLDPFLAGVLALGLNYAAYEAEVYRAGLRSVPHHQMEAAIALNMTRSQSIRHVIVPQAVRISLPPTTNDFISMIKDSSLVSVIALVELTQTYEQLSTTYYDYFGTGILVAAIYFLLGIPFVRLARWAENKVSRGMTRGT